VLREDVIFFLKTNPNPLDVDLHAWAESMGYDVDKAETEIYKLATKFVTFLTNGRANELGVTEEDVDAEQLKMGIDVEHEHTPDDDVAKRIALDHLSEISDYYSKLKIMEGD
jgi:hypothetical protein